MNDCKTCAWAEWGRTPTGRIKRSDPGRCNAPLPSAEELALPASVMVRLHKYMIWADHAHKNCKVWLALPQQERMEGGT